MLIPAEVPANLKTMRGILLPCVSSAGLRPVKALLIFMTGHHALETNHLCQGRPDT